MSRARAAVTAVFFLNGMVFVSWYSRLPSIQDQLDLGTGALGLALLGAPARPAARPAADRGAGGDRRLAPARGRGPAAARGRHRARAGGRRAHARARHARRRRRQRRARRVDERRGARGGARARAGASSTRCTPPSRSGRSPAPRSAASPPPPASTRCRTWRSWSRSAPRPAALPRSGCRPPRPSRRRAARASPGPSRRLAALGAIAFCALLAEGAVFDWSGIFMRREAGAAVGLAPAGLAAFNLAMGFGRLSADGVAERRRVGRGSAGRAR